jgi:hypothetical protein
MELEDEEKDQKFFVFISYSLLLVDTELEVPCPLDNIMEHFDIVSGSHIDDQIDSMFGYY